MKRHPPKPGRKKGAKTAGQIKKELRHGLRQKRVDEVKVEPVRWRMASEIGWDPPDLRCMLCEERTSAAFIARVTTKYGKIRRLNLVLCADHAEAVRRLEAAEVVEAITAKMWTEAESGREPWRKLQERFHRLRSQRLAREREAEAAAEAAAAAARESTHGKQ